MTKIIKLIKIVDDFSFLIIKFDDQVDPRQIEDRETHVLMYETILNMKITSELVQNSNMMKRKFADIGNEFYSKF